MTSKEFVELCLVTESRDFPKITARLSEQKTIRLLHAAMGMCTEANEFLDAMKAYIFYGKPLDYVNLTEELGDSDWYKGIAVDELDCTFEQIWALVIAKLKRRYGAMFDEFAATNRDLAAERKVLEGEKQ